MKTIKGLIGIGLMLCFAACQGQTKPKEDKSITVTKALKKDTVKPKKQTNMLDMQTKIYGDIFTIAGENNPLQGATNYKDLIGKMDLPAEQKQMLYDQYKIYMQSTDPAKKDSLKRSVGKMLEKAMEKTEKDPIE